MLCVLYNWVRVKKIIRRLETNILWATGREQKRLEVALLSEVFVMTVNKLGETH